VTVAATSSHYTRADRKRYDQEMTENTSYDEKQVVVTVRRDSVMLLLIH